MYFKFGQIPTPELNWADFNRFRGGGGIQRQTVIVHNGSNKNLYAFEFSFTALKWRGRHRQLACSGICISVYLNTQASKMAMLHSLEEPLTSHQKGGFTTSEKTAKEGNVFHTTAYAREDRKVTVSLQKQDCSYGGLLP